MRHYKTKKCRAELYQNAAELMFVGEGRLHMCGTLRGIMNPINYMSYDMVVERLPEFAIFKPTEEERGDGVIGETAWFDYDLEGRMNRVMILLLAKQMCK